MGSCAIEPEDQRFFRIFSHLESSGNLGLSFFPLWPAIWGEAPADPAAGIIKLPWDFTGEILSSTQGSGKMIKQRKRGENCLEINHVTQGRDLEMI